MTTWNAQLYDQMHSFVSRSAYPLVDLLAPQPGEFLLDLGCGTGDLTADIARRGTRVIGLDSSEEMLREARTKYPELTFVHGDARQFHFDDPFDAIFSNAALHWIHEAEDAAACIHRALRMGGRFVAEFGGRGNVRRVEEAIVVEAAGRGVSIPQPLWYFPSIAEYSSLLERQGFEVVFATLFDRPTDLQGELGLRAWIAMFCSHVLDRFASEHRNDVVRQMESRLRPHLCRDGTWFIDYRRLRIVAMRVR
jgi:trans-aconitate 2-methyltransferase